ncbi:MAG: hypothetical protein PHE32_00980 [Candidatus Shapirobacteria bacterium]|nr:hypothetical protein [Candidatus Shapirobacteria bacterium]MDD4410266.1 hypothetical protein [Candidatus Shapirobacteria bacterium]
MLQFKALVKNENDEKTIGRTTIEIDIKKVDDNWYLLPSDFYGNIVKGEIKITKGTVTTELVNGLTIINGTIINTDNCGRLVLTINKESTFKINGDFKLEKADKSKIFVKKGSKIFFFDGERDNNFKTNYPSANVCFVFNV